MGRPPDSGVAMTAAERQRRYRSNLIKARDAVSSPALRNASLGVTSRNPPPLPDAQAMAYAMANAIGADLSRQVAMFLLSWAIWHDAGRPADFERRHADTLRKVRDWCHLRV